jgi:nitrogenase subunit NifH
LKRQLEVRKVAINVYSEMEKYTRSTDEVESLKIKVEELLYNRETMLQEIAELRLHASKVDSKVIEQLPTPEIVLKHESEIVNKLTVKDESVMRSV